MLFCRFVLESQAIFLGKSFLFFVDREPDRMIRRINGEFGRPAEWAKRSGAILRESRRERIDKDTGDQLRADLRLNRSNCEPSVVEVSRVWDSAGNKPKGRFDAYHNIDPIQLGMYIDVYV
jgi:hypothetical protein